MALINDTSSVRHLLIIEQSKDRKSIALEKSQYSIGRQSVNDIVIKSQQASRKHATLVRKSKNQPNQYSYWILDGDLEGNKSHNGIYVNGEKCLVNELKDGDLINFGCEVNASYHILRNVDKMPLSSNNYKSQETVEILTVEGEVTPRKVLPINDNSRQTYPNSEQKSMVIFSEHHMSVSNENTLPEQMYIDSLTELPNKNLFNEYLSIAIGNAKLNHNYLAILYFDIENFRYFNEKLGVTIGDQILKEFGQQLKNSLRTGDIIARWSGDDFTVLLPKINTIEDLPKICQRIRESLSVPFQIKQEYIEIKTNLGFAIYPEDGQEGMAILKKAEINAKQKNQQTKIENFDPNNFPYNTTIPAQNSQSSKIETLIKQALKNQEFSLYYQPQINIKAYRIDGIEALLRWYHPQFGAIYPNQFIPWLDKSELVITLTKWIIKTVCYQHQNWQKLGFTFLPVSINLSSAQLRHPALLKILNQILLETGFDPSLMIVEITEKTLLEDAAATFRVLHELKQLGIKGSIDDFGTGCTAVSHLQQFPFYQVKIAQSLIQSLRNNSQQISMIAAVIALGRTFNLTVVAEGVETQQQLEILRKLGCEIMQGYLFTQPISAKETNQFLTLHRSKKMI